MSNTIIELAKSYLGDAFAQNASSQLNESKDGVSKALDAIVPTIFAAIGQRAEGDSSFMSSVFSLAKNIFTNGSLNNLGNVFGSNQSASATQAGTFVNNLFGNSFHSIIEKIATYAGIGSASTRDLFEASSVSTLGSIGRHAVENGATVDSIVDLFRKDKDNMLSAIPASLGIGSLLANITSSVTGTPQAEYAKEENVHTQQQYNNHEPEEKKSGNKFLLPLLLGIVGAVLLLFLLRTCNDKRVDDTRDTVSVTGVDTTLQASDTSLANVERETLVVTLPSGATVNAYKGGIEDQIVTFLKSADYTNANNDQLKERWFNFDNINFEFGTANLTPDSKVQLDNLMAILKEFPEAKIKVGAYTDKVGDEAANLRLSQNRADAVKNALADAGNQVTGAEGYGEQFATVAETASDKEREADRKTAIRFEK